MDPYYPNVSKNLCQTAGAQFLSGEELPGQHAGPRAHPQWIIRTTNCLTVSAQLLGQRPGLRCCWRPCSEQQGQDHMGPGQPVGWVLGHRAWARDALQGAQRNCSAKDLPRGRPGLLGCPLRSGARPYPVTDVVQALSPSQGEGRVRGSCCDKF